MFLPLSNPIVRNGLQEALQVRLRLRLRLNAGWTHFTTMLLFCYPIPYSNHEIPLHTSHHTTPQIISNTLTEPAAAARAHSHIRWHPPRTEFIHRWCRKSTPVCACRHDLFALSTVSNITNEAFIHCICRFARYHGGYGKHHILSENTHWRIPQNVELIPAQGRHSNLSKRSAGNAFLTQEGGCQYIWLKTPTCGNG